MIVSKNKFIPKPRKYTTWVSDIDDLFEEVRRVKYIAALKHRVQRLLTDKTFIGAGLVSGTGQMGGPTKGYWGDFLPDVC